MKSRVYAAHVLLLAAFFISVHQAEGMIRTLPVQDLIISAEYIVIVEVSKITETGYLPDKKITLLRNELKVIESLKGSLSPSDSVVINTIKGEHWLEDNVEIPPPGSRVFMFLRKNQKGEVRPVNGIQGIWPMEGSKLLGMGTGKNLDDIRKMIKRDSPAVPHN